MPNPAVPRTLLYFAYGSNMSTPRLQERVGRVRRVAVARLDAHALRFHKRGRDGTAKCDASCTGREGDAVHGVVFEIPAGMKPRLDRIEGLGNGYELKHVVVTDAAGAAWRAFTYSATHIDAGLQPFHWYREHVLRGALEHGLPAEYIDAIRRVTTRVDPDAGRVTRELAIHAAGSADAPD